MDTLDDKELNICRIVQVLNKRTDVPPGVWLQRMAKAITTSSAYGKHDNWWGLHSESGERIYVDYFTFRKWEQETIKAIQRIADDDVEWGAQTIEANKCTLRTVILDHEQVKNWLKEQYKINLTPQLEEPFKSKPPVKTSEDFREAVEYLFNKLIEEGNTHPTELRNVKAFMEELRNRAKSNHEKHDPYISRRIKSVKVAKDLKKKCIATSDGKTHSRANLSTVLTVLRKAKNQ